MSTPFDLWPFAGSDATDLDQVKAQAGDYLQHALANGLCISAILADAFQSPPVTASVVARAAFVGELVASAQGCSHTVRPAITPPCYTSRSEARKSYQPSHVSGFFFV